MNHAILSNAKEAIQVIQTWSKSAQDLVRLYECMYTNEHIYKILGTFRIKLITGLMYQFVQIPDIRHHSIKFNQPSNMKVSKNIIIFGLEIIQSSSIRAQIYWQRDREEGKKEHRSMCKILAQINLVPFYW